MHQFISTIFAVAFAVSAFSAISATSTNNADDASAIGTSEAPQIKQQNLRTDKGAVETNTGGTNDAASNLGNSESPQVVEQNKRTEKGAAQPTEGDHHKKSKLQKTKEQNAGTTKGNKVQPTSPEAAAPATN
ncbi:MULTISPECIES: hypothetical protein [Methylotenera]|uniref:hypothetical protein n=1 Tax=Methylotenera TaxID=359407 RepID=UPI00039F7962|nr:MULTISPECIES: hypothetical protein [Methylotenera]